MAKQRIKWFYTEVLGKEVDLDSFDEKLMVQKAAFIAQKLGLNFGYVFGWYVRGVYSSKLTVDMYELRNTEPTYKPTKQDLTILNKVKPVADILEGTGMYEKPGDAYELTSTVLWAQKDRPMKTTEEITQYTKTMKPWFKDDHINKALQYTKQI
jgi:uncharacterized protein YwgA